MREYYRKKLNKMLSHADDEAFIQLLWATHTLQSDNPEPARNFLRYETIPDGAIGAKIPSQHSIHKWEIETLANELMTTSKAVTKRNGRIRYLRCDHFGVATECVNWLRKLENAEFTLGKKREDIFIETGRIAARQFDWQRGFANMPQLYRNIFVYGQGACAEYFENMHGISLNRFSQIGFMLFASLICHPFVRSDDSLAVMGVKQEELARALKLITIPFPMAASIAKEIRRRTIHTADKPSILRRTPCLRFGKRGERIRAPLPELILERVTSGIFYDVVGGGGQIRDDYGKRFESYCARYLAEILPGFEWEKEFRYRKKQNNFDTPDILCKRNGEISIVFECKATRMSQQAMFGTNPIGDRGYKDITKAVFQIWRFCAHSRQGITGRTVNRHAIGVVLTLDNWLVMAETLHKQVLADAEKIALESASGITEADKLPIVFVAIPELERILSNSTENTFLNSLQMSNTEKYWGWRIDGVHKHLYNDADLQNRPYPFGDELGKLIPWWDEFREEKVE